MTEPDLLAALRAFVEAHPQPHPSTGSREPIYYFAFDQGGSLQHHALPDPPPKVDQAFLEEMQREDLLNIDYGENTWRLTPTQRARELIADVDRLESADPVADVGFVVSAVESQAAADSKLTWSAVRPVLAALRSYWESGGLSPHGIISNRCLRHSRKKASHYSPRRSSRCLKQSTLGRPPALSKQTTPGSVIHWRLL